ncbi:hypothetical protein PLICRDRAFT_156720 [Plicaturopsis crispa FD-325 SS-3]|nr:hypothetical protein PLICRDRAFT_156720 [Plicaturopsis crispa FD-325 SS-3]
MAKAPPATLTFQLTNPAVPKFGARLGRLVLERSHPSPKNEIEILTPGLLTSTSRGVVPHLSQDHVRITRSIQWLSVPFETFLEQTPPVTTLLKDNLLPLHACLGYAPAQHVICMTPRDPFDARVMPSNGNDHISVHCLRGMRKLTPAAWNTYVQACRPDIAVALADIPYTRPPHSQKRITKTIERSTAWLASMLKAGSSAAKDPNHAPLDTALTHRIPILLPLVGGPSLAARRVFSEGIVETLHGKEADDVYPLKSLDEGVAGYTLDLVPLRMSLLHEQTVTDHSPLSNADALDSGNTPTPNIPTSALLPLLQASLTPLSITKPRITNSAISPHEMLCLIRDVGIDLFDAHWAQRAADIGIALDFTFTPTTDIPTGTPRVRDNGKRDLGHNLYDPRYATDFSPLSTTGTCPCTACAPAVPHAPISHSTLDEFDATSDARRSPHTRAYIHHLLMTHEMSALAFLVTHNLSVLSAFFASVRAVLADPEADAFAREVQRFCETHDEDGVVFDEAKVMWADVEFARGKGRMAREKAKQEATTLGTAVEL